MKDSNPYDLNNVGIGYNQPCKKCGKVIDKTSGYEPIGYTKYCKCKKKKI